MTESARSLLELLYLPEAIYLRQVSDFSTEEKSATARFLVPRSHSYTHQPIEYVTAEQYIRCLSQLSYVLTGFLVQNKIADLGLKDFETFKRLMVECKMWFRRSSLRYLKNIPKGTDFELTLALKEASLLRVFSVCVLEVSGAVRGELEFVALVGRQEQPRAIQIRAVEDVVTPGR